VEQTLEASLLSGDAKQNISHWLSDEKFAYYKEELELLIKNEEWKLLEDAFFRVIPFGTGGRRGTCGIGSNRINRVTIGETQQAFCDYLHQLYPEKDITIAVAYDSRITSEEFATYCARVAAGNNIKVMLFDGPRATPELSFLVQSEGLEGGVVITASHNPSTDNGIKLYWNDGGQLVPPHDKAILDLANSVAEIKTSRDNIISSEHIEIIGKYYDEMYWQAAVDCMEADNTDLKVAYSPLHGTGITSVYPSLKKAGFDVYLVSEQADMDGHFPNVTNNIPNPEVPAANDKLAQYGKDNQCDIATSNDPDADRYCVLVRNSDGDMVQLNGNQAAVLMTDYVLRHKKEKGELTSKHFISSTIVTTDMLTTLADHYNVMSVSNLLVGFKYIGEQINLLHDNGDNIFLCGGEESYGGIIGTYCRDKDAAGPTVALCEYAALLKKEDKTLLDRLDELYTEHGYFGEDLHSIQFPGADGFSKMQQFMKSLREKTPERLYRHSVVKVRDYLTGEEIQGKSENVVRLEVSDDGRNRVTIRPSGTEPKLKIYAQVFQPVEGNLGEAKAIAQERIIELRDALIDMVDEIAP
jgi:phosphoglucomutase